jgi:deazaflavin-dependent oxidoreductase (nitroreductase family)
MVDSEQPQFLYLTTIGRKTGKLHQIEIWFVEYDGKYYLVSEFPERSDWVRNILHNSEVTVRVGTRDAEPIPCLGRAVDRTVERTLGAAVARLMDAKYNWSDGQIVELTPAQ